VARTTCSASSTQEPVNDDVLAELAAGRRRSHRTRHRRVRCLLRAVVQL